MATGTFPSAPSFTSRVPVQFISRDIPALSITGANVLTNNPSSYKIATGSLSGSDPGLDGLSYYRGDGEFAPFSIEMQWSVLGISDYLRLAALRPYYIDFVSFRNLGYFGKFVLSGPQSAAGKTADAVSATLIFRPLAPSDQGGAQVVARLSVPPAPSVVTGSGGSIAASTPTYYWQTFSSLYGETTPVAFSVTSGSGGAAVNTITWAWPTTTSKCTGSTIYVNSTNNVATAKKLAWVPNGLTPTWIDHVGYAGLVVPNATAPPTSNTAYRGDWMGGIWFSESP